MLESYPILLLLLGATVWIVISSRQGVRQSYSLRTDKRRWIYSRALGYWAVGTLYFSWRVGSALIHNQEPGTMMLFFMALCWAGLGLCAILRLYESRKSTF